MLKDEEIPQTETGATRRDFIGKALAAGAGLVIGAALPHSGEIVEAQSTPTCSAVGQTLGGSMPNGPQI